MHRRVLSFLPARPLVRGQRADILRRQRVRAREQQPPAAPAGQIIDHERIHHGPGLMAPSGFVTPKR